MTNRDALLAKLQGGAATVCRLWHLRRQDGTVMGFTDHDRDLTVEGVIFRAASGLSAAAIERSTGLAVDNTEGWGALSDQAIREEDILAGRLDAAEVTIWLADWQEPLHRLVLFRGAIGDIKRSGGTFRAELRGLTERLNQARGRIFQAHCSAVLGDAACGIDLSLPAHSVVVTIAAVDADGALRFPSPPGFAAGHFQHGRYIGLGPRLSGLSGPIRADRIEGADRLVYPWIAPGLDLMPGDQIRLQAGCDRLAATCRGRFDNFDNFRGFPHIPGEDWVLAIPSGQRVNDGGSMNA